MFKHFHDSILSLCYPRPSSWSFSIFSYLLTSLMIINLQFSCNKFRSSPIFLQHIRYKITIQFKYQPDSFEICNISDTSIKHDHKHWNPIISIMSINQHATSSVLVYLQCTYLFPHCSFLWCPPSQHIKCQQYFKYQSKSPNTRTIPTLRVSPLCYSGCLSLFFIQATQHKDDTLYPS